MPALLGAILLTALAAVQDSKRLKDPPEDFVTVRRPQPFPWATATTTGLDSDDVRDFGGRFFTDSLRRVPGLEVQRISSTESNVSARTYNDDSSSAQGILGLLDGRQVYNDFFGGVFWETIPVTLDDIERVDVIRGPGSFLYGPNAMHGLINIETRSPMKYKMKDGKREDVLDEELSLSGSYGSYRSSTETITYIRREPTFGFKGKLVRDDIDEFEPSGKNTKDKLFCDLRYETLLGGDPNQHLDVGAGASQQKFDVLIPTFGSVFAAQFATESQEEYARAVYTAGSLESWGRLRVAATFTHFDATANPAGISVPIPVYMPFRVVLDSGDFDVQYSNELIKNHLVTGGAGVRGATFTTEDQDVADGRHGTVLGWVFVQDEITLDPALRLTLGARLDHHSVTGNAVSPRVAAVWQLAKQEDVGHYLRASAGYGFRNPSLRELWFDMPVLGGAGRIIGNKHLEPEQMRSFELGYWGQPIPRLRTTANVYFNLVDRLVQFLDPTGTNVFQPFNDDKDRAYGTELEIEFQAASWLYTFGNYSFGIRRNRDTGDDNLSGPRNKANLGARISFVDDRLTASLWATYFGKVEFVDPAGGNRIIGTVHEYGLLNARLAYRLPFAGTDSLAFIQAFNLLDRDHREHPEGDSYGLLLLAGFESHW
jgi:iron complex outermembrane receptor protein